MDPHVIPFEPRRFATAAPHYLQGRPAYAAGLFRRVADLVGLGPRHAVLDLGCGPGQLAAGFALFAGAVVAMDPEPEMLAIAASRVEGGLTNVTFARGSSYDLGDTVPLAPFRLVTIGRAFHWMDRADTLRRLDALVEADGAVALVSDDHPRVPRNAWLAEFNAIRRRYAGEDGPAWRQPGWPSHEAMLLAGPFRRLERIGVIEQRRVPAERLVDRALSMSSSSRGRLGDRADAFAAEVAALANGVARDGLVDEVVETTALLAWRGP
jgi:SAM-dependent methyltransferase